MRTIDVVLDTLAHFVKQEAGPPPGIPVRVEPEFERKLVQLCERHLLAPLVLDSLRRLALEPALSEIAFERLRTLSNASGTQNEKFLAAFRALSGRLRERRVPCLLVDDTLAALKLYPRHRLRPIESLDALIHENDWETFVDACRSLGFRRNPLDPVFVDGTEAMLYYQYFSPCMLRGDKGISIGVKFRLVDGGHPPGNETAWLYGKRLGRDIEAMRVSYEDQLIRSCIGFNMTGFGRLLHAVDVGRIIARHGDALDWSYVEKVGRDRSFYPALYFSCETVMNMFRFLPKRRVLPHPGKMRKKVFEMNWRPGHLGSLADRAVRLHRLRFAFLENGTCGEKLKLATNLLLPRADWVSGFFDSPSRPWLKLRFTVLALRNRLGFPNPDAQNLPKK